MESRFRLNQCSHGSRSYDDCISPLPDEILFLILSFLTVTEMVKTGVLSRRWLNLWINTAVLDFQFQGSCYSDSERERMQCKNFVESVNLVLRRHICQCLKKFKTAFHLKYARSHQKDIDGWLEFALARKVEILELNFVLPGRLQNEIYTYVFPDRYLQFDLLRCLKSLSLKGVCIDGVAINVILQNCPVLERLELVCNYALRRLVISDPSLVLKHLQIKHCPCLEVFSISNIKLVSLDTDVGDFILSDLPMLVELSLFGARNILSHYFSQLASYLPQLEALTLLAMYMKEFTELSNVAHLTKLKRLVIVVGAWANESMIMLLPFMKHSHNFEEFVLELLWFDQSRYRGVMCGFESFDLLSSTALPSLKVFKFHGYLGRVCDFELIVHVVKNAPNLQKIIIKPDNMLLGLHKRPVNIFEEQVRNFALKQIGALRESEYMPTHVDLVIC